MYADQGGHVRSQLALVNHDKFFSAGKRAITRYLEDTPLGRQFRFSHTFDGQRLRRVSTNERFNRRLVHIASHLRFLKINSLPETRAKKVRVSERNSPGAKRVKRNYRGTVAHRQVHSFPPVVS